MIYLLFGILYNASHSDEIQIYQPPTLRECVQRIQGLSAVNYLFFGTFFARTLLTIYIQSE
jgi:hypothetical protein